MDELTTNIHKAQKGDRDAYGHIYQLFYKRIYRYCEFNLKNRAEAQDICQEAFLKAWQALPRFSLKNGGSWQAFLFKIARNLIIDRSRKKHETSLEFAGEIESHDSIDEKIDTDSEIGKLKNALSKLGEDERQIVVLHYFEEMTQEEVAKIIGIKHGALRVRTHRILKKLKDLIENGD